MVKKKKKKVVLTVADRKLSNRYYSIRTFIRKKLGVPALQSFDLEYGERPIKEKLKLIEELRNAMPKSRKAQQEVRDMQDCKFISPNELLSAKVIKKASQPKDIFKKPSIIDLKEEIGFEVDNPTEKQLEARQRYENRVKMFLAEWCSEYPNSNPEAYLSEIKKLDEIEIRNIFFIVPVWKWNEKQKLFADEMVRRITLRGANRAIAEYDKDINFTSEVKAQLYDMIMEGYTEIEKNEDGEKKESRRPLEIQEIQKVVSSYETVQKIMDRALGITDQNRDVVISNLRKQRVEEVEENDEVREIKRLTVGECKDIVSAIRTARTLKDETKTTQNDTGHKAQ